MKNHKIKIFSLLFIAVISGFNTKAQFNPNIDFTLAAENSIHSVVHIQCEATEQSIFYDDFFSFFLPPQIQERVYHTSGSGVIIEENGYIITNNHVIQNAEKIKVILNDKRIFDAVLVGNDPACDLAVIKIETTNLTPLQFGNSDEVKIGEWVLAVGNPFNLTSTVTAGIVSAKARNLNIWGNRMHETPIESFIQTDAAVNQGNSGGALVNLKGELIGINTAIASSTGTYTGYSFAIPSNIVKKVTSDLIKYGQTQKAHLGVHFAETDSQIAKSRGVNSLKGIYIAEIIQDAGAYKAGIKAGDIITKIENKEVNTYSELNEILSQLSPGDEVKVEINREGKTIEKTVTLLNENGNTEIIKK